MKNRYSLLLAAAFMIGYMAGAQILPSQASAQVVTIQAPTPQITYIIGEPLTIERAIEEYEQSLTATVTPLPDNIQIITATPQPTATPWPVIVNDAVTVY